MTDLRQAAQAVIDRWDSPLWKAGSTADAIADLRAALAQQADPVYKDSTPHLHVGYSAFESWFQAQPFATQIGIKQISRDSYAAGMGDPLVVAAPQQQAEPVAQRSDGMPISKMERELRLMLCIERHGRSAYMDDGEASFCGDKYCRSIDYMRESVESIKQAWYDAAVKKLAGAQLKQQAEPVQEPFGYLWPTGRHPEFRFTQQKRDGADGMPLYTTPPQQQAEPVQEPVAWNWMQDEVPCSPAYFGTPPDKDIAQVAAAHGKTVRMLYTAPLQRKPLTIAEVEQILAQHNYEIHGDRARYIVRMTEEAHGIKEGA